MLFIFGYGTADLPFHYNTSTYRLKNHEYKGIYFLYFACFFLEKQAKRVSSQKSRR